MQPRHLGENYIRLCGGTGRRIAYFASQNDKWLALNEKLSTGLINSNSRTAFRLGLNSGQDEPTNQQNGKQALQTQAPFMANHCRIFGNPGTSVIS